jgi:Metal binding domain of Ada
LAVTSAASTLSAPCSLSRQQHDPQEGYWLGSALTGPLLSQEEAAQIAAKYVLLGADCRPYLSTMPGQLGGHRRSKLYGRLDCPAALRAIAAGGFVRHRVFFADEATAVTAGYRPCAACLPDAYRKWKNA